MEDMVRRDDGDDDDDGLDTDDASDKSTAIGDEAVDVAVDKVMVFAAPGAIGPGN